MAKKFNLASELRGAIRLIFRRSPLHKAALQKARVEKQVFNKDGKPSRRKSVYYTCDSCQGEFRITHVEIHHLEKIGPAPGTKFAPDDLTWTDFIGRVFCDLSKLSVVCIPCHRQLTREGK